MNFDGYRVFSHASLEAVTLASRRTDNVQTAPTDDPRKSPTGDPGQRTTEFRAVEGGAETTSGATLLVEAYAALWIILFGFVVVSWRRQSRIDARVAELERSLSRGQAK
jgi:CcmD family protein